MTQSESGWCLAEAVASSLGDHVVVRTSVGPPPLLVIPNRAAVVQSSSWRVFGCKGGWPHFPLQMQRKLGRGAKGLLHMHLNFSAFKISGSLNFFTSICIHIYIYIYIYSTKHICGKKTIPAFSYRRNSYTVPGLQFTVSTAEKTNWLSSLITVEAH